MKKLFILLALALAPSIGALAQRQTDILDRGLVAVKTTGGVFVSWRIFGEEYYDVKYNLYRNGTKLNSEPLSVSNFTDKSGTLNSSYTVAPVVRGVEKTMSAEVKPWSKDYFEIPMQPVYDRKGHDITDSHSFVINDVSLADLDGDGVSEFLVKRINGLDDLTVNNDSAFTWLEAYKMDGTRLWYIDCGPNMVSGSSVEINIVAYDWDGDGKAEVLLRGADNMYIHYNGGVQLVGNANVNTRNTLNLTANMTYTNTGDEFLIYMNGETGEPYQIMEYPLKRGQASDWGDSYGHRSSKYFFGAPFLDGRKPSIFLARGIYTKHHMMAYDVDAASHSLVKRWEWKSDGLDGAWYGQGYHNYGIADVDWDGRDEIVYGSMVIDDNGKGLSTTGLGHGDAQHCSDLDPYRHGQEIFACNESQPSCNYRDATTSKLYYRLKGTDDDGRAMAGNFTNDYPGTVGCSTQSGLIGCSSGKLIEGASKANIEQNFRIYWDGDLLEETVNSPGTERECIIVKYGTGRIYQTSGVKMNNWSKNTPNAQGDILGDWREELILRSSDNKTLRIYTTTTPTEYRNYTLWHDHQYRQGMVWEMCGYNQPPHTSYFLGELEGITVAPPPLTMTGRTEIANGGTIGAEYNDKHIIVCETNNSTVTVSEGATPYIATFNVPTWVQGSNNDNNIQTTTYTCDVKGSAFTGSMHLVKQGDGVLNLPNVTQTYTGSTDVWAGTINFDGTMNGSKVWLNRFAELVSNGGTFSKGITMEYDSKLRPGTEEKAGTISTDTLDMNFGSRVVFDLFEDGTVDKIAANVLNIETKDWEYGPEYLTPVFEIVNHGTEVKSGKYLLAEVKEIGGDINDFEIVGDVTSKPTALSFEDGKIYLTITDARANASITWNGQESDVWDYAVTKNFTNTSDPLMTESDIFVNGDNVLFDDTAEKFDVSLDGGLTPDSVVVNNTKAYTFSGDGKLTGKTVLVKRGAGVLTMSNDNTYTGGTRISEGTVRVSSLSNSAQAYGNLGGVTSTAAKFIIENGATLQSTSTVQMGSPINLRTSEGGVLINASDFIMDMPFSGTLLTKKGTGTLRMNTSNTVSKLVIAAGTVQMTGDYSPAGTVEFQGGTLQDCDDNRSYSGSSFNVYVPENKSGTWYLDSRCDYTNKLTGKGTLTVNVPWYRCYMAGDWSAFEGTVKATVSGEGMWSFNNSYGLPKGTLDVSSGCTIYNGGKTFTIGKIKGSGKLGTAGPNLSGNNTWKVGNDEDYKWEGEVIGNGTAFSKVGSGKLTLTAAHSFTGAMRVEAGELHLNSKALLGTGTLTVAKGATLSGTTNKSTPLTNSSYTINGTLQIGMSATLVMGYMDVGEKNVTFNSGSVLDIGVSGRATSTSTGCSHLAGVKKLTMNGTLKIHLSSSYTPQEGDSIIVWQAETFSGNPKFDLPELPAPFKWNTSKISEGKLLLDYDPTGIADIAADEEVNVEVYSINGVLIDNFTSVMDNVQETFSSKSYDKGTYVLKINGKSGHTSQTINK